MILVVNEVTLAQIDGQFSIRRCFFEDFNRRDHGVGWVSVDFVKQSNTFDSRIEDVGRDV